MDAKIAVILAAGIGSRLRPLTFEKPKCMVCVSRIPILEHQLLAYEQAGFEKIWVVAGFRADVIREWITSRQGSRRIEVIENTEFENTNNMYSLFLLRSQLVGHSFYLSNGDVIFAPTILNDLSNCNKAGSAIAVDKSQFIEESMKIVLDPASDQIQGISKSYTQEEAFAVSIDLYRFSKTTSNKFFSIIDNYINIKSERYHWTEVALNELLKMPCHDFQPADIGNKVWMEVDNMVDLSRAEILFCPNMKSIVNARAFIFDMDGTLLLGGKALAGACETVSALQKEKHVFFCTNNSARSRVEHAKFLQRLGFNCRPENIISSALATITYLRTHAFSRLYVLGTSDLHQEFEAAGFDCSNLSPEIVVIGFDTTLNFEKLSKITTLISNGLPYILTHPDPSCPTCNGPIPDAGAIGVMVRAVTGKEAQAVLGKPASDMLNPLFSQYNLLPEETVVVGDRLMTDITMAKNSGCHSILVLSGITSRHEVDMSAIQPSLILNSVDEFASIFSL